MAHRVLLRTAFDGVRFHGTQRQPDVPTVNQAILDALDRAGQLAPDPRLRAQGRVDAGVSARDHPIALDVTAPLDAVTRTVAGNTEGIVPYAGARVHDGFDPRLAARSRTYRYLVADTRRVDADRLMEVWRGFEGVHDVASFARLDPGRDQGTVRSIQDTRAWGNGEDGFELEVTAPSFLRHQVRRMVGAALHVARGELEASDVARALAGRELKTHAKADPTGLILWRVELGAAWRPLEEAEEIARRRLAADRAALLQRTRALEAVMGPSDEHP